MASALQSGSAPGEQLQSLVGPGAGDSAPAAGDGPLEAGASGSEDRSSPPPAPKQSGWSMSPDDGDSAEETKASASSSPLAPAGTSETLVEMIDVGFSDSD